MVVLRENTANEARQVQFLLFIERSWGWQRQRGLGLHAQRLLHHALHAHTLPCPIPSPSPTLFLPLPLRPQVAELLSQLPSEMDVEGLVSRAVNQIRGSDGAPGGGSRGGGSRARGRASMEGSRPRGASLDLGPGAGSGQKGRGSVDLGGGGSGQGHRKGGARDDDASSVASEDQ